MWQGFKLWTFERDPKGVDMNKAILVLDMPSSCNECSLMFEDEYSYFCPVKCDENKTDLYDNYIMLHRKPDWCPLKEIPDRKDVDWLADNAGWLCGWNDCLKEILDK